MNLIGCLPLIFVVSGLAVGVVAGEGSWFFSGLEGASAGLFGWLSLRALAALLDVWQPHLPRCASCPGGKRPDLRPLGISPMTTLYVCRCGQRYMLGRIGVTTFLLVAEDGAVVPLAQRSRFGRWHEPTTPVQTETWTAVEASWSATLREVDSLNRAPEHDAPRR